MKIIQSENGKSKLSMTKLEWIALGNKKEWFEELSTKNDESDKKPLKSEH